MPKSRNPARRRLSAVLNGEVPIVMALGLVALLTHGQLERVAGWAMVAVLIATPIGRVAWLASRWMRFDRTFAWAGWGLLSVLGAAAAMAVMLR
jgi:hypothetical protein